MSIAECKAYIIKCDKCGNEIDKGFYIDRPISVFLHVTKTNNPSLCKVASMNDVTHICKSCFISIIEDEHTD